MDPPKRLPSCLVADAAAAAVVVVAGSGGAVLVAAGCAVVVDGFLHRGRAAPRGCSACCTLVMPGPLRDGRVLGVLGTAGSDPGADLQCRRKRSAYKIACLDPDLPRADRDGNPTCPIMADWDTQKGRSRETSWHQACTASLPNCSVPFPAGSLVTVCAHLRVSRRCPGSHPPVTCPVGAAPGDFLRSLD